ncbi:MAG: hypothetical protein RI925_1456 [Pseudomonadota bacterium]
MGHGGIVDLGQACSNTSASVLASSTRSLHRSSCAELAARIRATQSAGSAPKRRVSHTIPKLIQPVGKEILPFEINVMAQFVHLLIFNRIVKNEQIC